LFVVVPLFVPCPARWLSSQRAFSFLSGYCNKMLEFYSRILSGELPVFRLNINDRRQKHVEENRVALSMSYAMSEDDAFRLLTAEKRSCFQRMKQLFYIDTAISSVLK
jgi:hypothetical protein